MNNEEAIITLYAIRADYLNLDDDYIKTQYNALSMAIKALEQQKIGRWGTELVKGEDWKGRKRRYYQPVSRSECHKPNGVETKYCPNCGARMESD